MKHKPIDELEEQSSELSPPTDWPKGALLNVRNIGDGYIVTLFPEESDPKHPDRTLRFDSPYAAQDFVSSWYARPTVDPRAF